jgi:hypothetical protein
MASSSWDPQEVLLQVYLKFLSLQVKIVLIFRTEGPTLLPETPHEWEYFQVFPLQEHSVPAEDEHTSENPGDPKPCPLFPPGDTFSSPSSVLLLAKDFPSTYKN